MINNSIRLKICGVTQPNDAHHIANLGVDAIGLVFYGKSKRFVNIDQSLKIIAALPPFVSIVGLFVNANELEITKTLQQLPIDILQFHGDETVEFCRKFHRPYIKAVRIKNSESIHLAINEYSDARALLFDAYVEGEFGGTGKHFNWNLIPKDIQKNWILSGGLNPENIIQALMTTRALNVDLSSGIELSPGRKDLYKIESLINNISDYCIQSL